MLQQCILRTYYVLALVLCISASEDFAWTKNEKTSFFYGTFPTGTTHDYAQNSPKNMDARIQSTVVLKVMFILVIDDNEGHNDMMESSGSATKATLCWEYFISHWFWLCTLCAPLQVSPGELEVLPIRPKEPGTQTAKEWASGTHSHTRRGKYS